MSDLNEQQAVIPVGTKVVVRPYDIFHKPLVEAWFYLDQPGVVLSGPDKDGDYIVLQDPERFKSDGEGWFIPGYCLDVIEEES